METIQSDNYSEQIIQTIKERLNLDSEEPSDEKIISTDQKIKRLLTENYQESSLQTILETLNRRFYKVTKEEENMTRDIVLKYYAIYQDNVPLLEKLLSQNFAFFEPSRYEDYTFVLDKDLSSLFSEEIYLTLLSKDKKIFYQLENSLKEPSAYLKEIISASSEKNLKEQVRRLFAETLTRDPNISLPPKKNSEKYERETLDEIDCGKLYDRLLSPEALLILGPKKLVSLSKRQKEMLNLVHKKNIKSMCDLLRYYPNYEIAKEISSPCYFTDELFELFTTEEIIWFTKEQEKLLANIPKDSYGRIKELYEINPEANIPLDGHSLSDLDNQTILNLTQEEAGTIGEIYENAWNRYDDYRGHIPFTSKIKIKAIKNKCHIRGKQKVNTNNQS